MGKEKKTKENVNNNQKGFKIPENAKKLAKLTYKKFKKESGDYYDNKKEAKKAYFAQIVDYLPDSIQVCVRYGHIPEMKETKEAIYNKLTDAEFIKFLKKEIKDGTDFDNMELMPNLIYDICKEASKAIEAAKNENPDKEIEFDLSDLIELSHLILKKKIKKMNKAGISDDLAFDVLSIIPTPSILKKSAWFHIRALFNVLYESAKTTDVNFDKLIKILFKDDEGYINNIITFALLERKEKISNYNDSQKKLFNDITEFCFREMEEMKKDDIYTILKYYVDSRAKDEAQNKDTNRRYYISSLPESDYPKITKQVEKIISINEDYRKYF